MLSNRTKYWLTIFICSVLGSILVSYTLPYITHAFRFFWKIGLVTSSILIFSSPFIILNIILLVIGAILFFTSPLVARKIASNFTNESMDKRIAFIATLVFQTAGAIILNFLRSLSI